MDEYIVYDNTDPFFTYLVVAKNSRKAEAIVSNQCNRPVKNLEAVFLRSDK